MQTFYAILHSKIYLNAAGKSTIPNHSTTKQQCLLVLPLIFKRLLNMLLCYCCGFLFCLILIFFCVEQLLGIHIVLTQIFVGCLHIPIAKTNKKKIKFIVKDNNRHFEAHTMCVPFYSAIWFSLAAVQETGPRDQQNANTIYILTSLLCNTRIKCKPMYSLSLYTRIVFMYKK